jgi:hypothetical protein
MSTLYFIFGALGRLISHSARTIELHSYHFMPHNLAARCCRTLRTLCRISRSSAWRRLNTLPLNTINRALPPLLLFLLLFALIRALLGTGVVHWCAVSSAEARNNCLIPRRNRLQHARFHCRVAAVSLVYALTLSAASYLHVLRLPRSSLARFSLLACANLRLNREHSLAWCFHACSASATQRMENTSAPICSRCFRCFCAFMCCLRAGQCLQRKQRSPPRIARCCAFLSVAYSCIIDMAPLSCHRSRLVFTAREL